MIESKLYMTMMFVLMSFRVVKGSAFLVTSSVFESDYAPQ
jgi:hypothetical protein